MKVDGILEGRGKSLVRKVADFLQIEAAAAEMRGTGSRLLIKGPAGWPTQGRTEQSDDNGTKEPAASDRSAENLHAALQDGPRNQQTGWWAQKHHHSRTPLTDGGQGRVEKNPLSPMFTFLMSPLKHAEGRQEIQRARPSHNRNITLRAERACKTENAVEGDEERLNAAAGRRQMQNTVNDDD
ncbi:hypothetical protein Bbelb_096100 [Branchiostoma belcheri]|nr:hypothetical protein Bbelb_096100 [Branchiostoma belcheri]